MSLKLWCSLIVASSLAITLSTTVEAKKSDKSSQEEETILTASIFGEAGERYVLYGSGGVTVTQSPKPGMWHSNMRSYSVCIDGGGMPASSAVPASFCAVKPEADFYAVAGFAYFVSQSATCTLPAASTATGKEVIVCNAGSGTITYNTAAAEAISGSPSGALTNATPYKIDRFISDGKNWYRE